MPNSGSNSEVKQRLAAALTSLNTKLCDHAEGALVQIWMPDVAADGSVVLSAQGLPFAIAGVGDLLALFRCVSCRYRFSTDVSRPSLMGAIGRVYASCEPEMSHNVQKYDRQVYLRVSEAQRCRVHSTLVLPVFDLSVGADDDAAAAAAAPGPRPVAIFELVQADRDVAFPEVIAQLRECLLDVAMTTSDPEVITSGAGLRKWAMAVDATSGGGLLGELADDVALMRPQGSDGGGGCTSASVGRLLLENDAPDEDEVNAPPAGAAAGPSKQQPADSFVSAWAQAAEHAQPSVGAPPPAAAAAAAPAGSGGSKPTGSGGGAAMEEDAAAGGAGSRQPAAGAGSGQASASAAAGDMQVDVGADKAAAADGAGAGDGGLREGGGDTDDAQSKQRVAQQGDQQQQQLQQQGVKKEADSASPALTTAPGEAAMTSAPMAAPPPTAAAAAAPGQQEEVRSLLMNVQQLLQQQQQHLLQQQQQQLQQQQQQQQQQAVLDPGAVSAAISTLLAAAGLQQQQQPAVGSGPSSNNAGAGGDQLALLSVAQQLQQLQQQLTGGAAGPQANISGSGLAPPAPPTDPVQQLQGMQNVLSDIAPAAADGAPLFPAGFGAGGGDAAAAGDELDEDGELLGSDDDDGELGGRGGKSSRLVGAGRRLTFEDLQAQFGLGLKEAAANLGICATTLKRACRRNGITRWPRRQIQKLNRTINQMGGAAQAAQSGSQLDELVASAIKKNLHPAALTPQVAASLQQQILTQAAATAAAGGGGKSGSASRSGSMTIPPSRSRSSGRLASSAGAAAGSAGGSYPAGLGGGNGSGSWSAQPTLTGTCGSGTSYGMGGFVSAFSYPGSGGDMLAPHSLAAASAMGGSLGHGPMGHAQQHMMGPHGMHGMGPPPMGYMQQGPGAMAMMQQQQPMMGGGGMMGGDPALLQQQQQQQQHMAAMYGGQQQQQPGMMGGPVSMPGMQGGGGFQAMLEQQDSGMVMQQQQQQQFPQQQQLYGGQHFMQQQQPGAYQAAPYGAPQFTPDGLPMQLVAHHQRQHQHQQPFAGSGMLQQHSGDQKQLLQPGSGSPGTSPSAAAAGAAGGSHGGTPPQHQQAAAGAAPADALGQLEAPGEVLFDMLNDDMLLDSPGLDLGGLGHSSGAAAARGGSAAGGDLRNVFDN